MMRKIDRAARRAAYEATQTDEEAARLLADGSNADSFGQWRRKQGWPAKSSAVLTPAQEQQRREAYESTNSDTAAAARLGISTTAFACHREARGWPNKDPRKVTFTREEHERRRAAYEAYSNDTDAARSLGVPAASMRYWREKNGLPTKSPHSLAPEEEQRRIGAYGKSSSDFEAAAQLGISQRTFTFGEGPGPYRPRTRRWRRFRNPKGSGVTAPTMRRTVTLRQRTPWGCQWDHTMPGASARGFRPGPTDGPLGS